LKINSKAAACMYTREDENLHLGAHHNARLCPCPLWPLLSEAYQPSALSWEKKIIRKIALFVLEKCWGQETTMNGKKAGDRKLKLCYQKGIVLYFVLPDLTVLWPEFTIYIVLCSGVVCGHDSWNCYTSNQTAFLPGAVDTAPSCWSSRSIWITLLVMWSDFLVVVWSKESDLIILMGSFQIGIFYGSILWFCDSFFFTRHQLLEVQCLFIPQLFKYLLWSSPPLGKTDSCFPQGKMSA